VSSVFETFPIWKTVLHLTSYISYGPSWPWSYGSWIYNYLCNQCLLPLMSIRARCTTWCDTLCQWHATGRWFSPGPPVSSTNTTNGHDINEILLKVALNTIKQTNKHTNNIYCVEIHTPFYTPSLLIKYQVLLLTYLLCTLYDYMTNIGTALYPFRGRHNHPHMVTGFITTCVISPYHH
jgi:hypothetical protein